MAPTLTEQLGTITAIVALALGVVQVLKMMLMKYRVGIVNSLPTPLICVGVSMGLTLVANLVVKTLPGEWYDLLWQAALAAGAASGLFSWLSEPMDSPENKSSKITLIIPFLLPLVLVGGCTWSTATMTPEQKVEVSKAQFGEASEIYQGTANTVATIIRLKVLKEADAKTLVDVSNAARAVLDEWAAAIELKLPTDQIIARWKAVIADLVAKRIAAQRATRELSASPQAAGDEYVWDSSGIDSNGSWLIDYAGHHGARPADRGLGGDRQADQGGQPGDGRADRGLDTGQRDGRRRRAERLRRDVRHARRNGGETPLDRWRPGKPIPAISVDLEFD